ALGRFLRAMGVPSEAIPEDADERAEMFRHRLARKRMLIVLDDAATEAQVTPLLPGSGNCVVLATSRARLTGVAGAHVIDVDVLRPQARNLLGLLGLLDGPSFPSWVAAALLDADYLDAADLLELLVDAQMVEVAALDVTGGPRYRLHGLIRLFAREQLEHTEADGERRAAAGRVAGGWLALAEEAHGRIYGGDFTVLHGS